MDNSVSVCPFCDRAVPSQEIERHANDHLDHEQLSRDWEFAKLIAVAPPSPPSPPLVVDSAIHCKTDLLDSHQSSSSRDAPSTHACGGSSIDAKICSLISLQIKETFYHVEGGLMALLKNCLASESGNVTSIVSGYVDHFQSRESEDVGWGCGWRNIQMLSSHLITQRQEAREVLYGGAGFVPDIGSLQGWLELAWEQGFDTQGSDDFGREIYGKRNWIGTTECAALLRSFGLRAMIVDFCNKGMQLASSSTTLNCGEMVSNEEIVGKRKLLQVYGPMDRFLTRGDRNLSHQFSTGPEGRKYSHAPVGKAKGPGVIIDWVWNYFSDHNSTKPGCQRVVLSEKAPLYFQHDGHSRTIVGIQAKCQSSGMHLYSLLVLDPAHVSILKRNCTYWWLDMMIFHTTIMTDGHLFEYHNVFEMAAFPHVSNLSSAVLSDFSLLPLPDEEALTLCIRVYNQLAITFVSLFSVIQGADCFKITS